MGRMKRSCRRPKCRRQCSQRSRHGCHSKTTVNGTHGTQRQIEELPSAWSESFVPGGREPPPSTVFVVPLPTEPQSPTEMSPLSLCHRHGCDTAAIQSRMPCDDNFEQCVAQRACRCTLAAGLDRVEQSGISTCWQSDGVERTGGCRVVRVVDRQVN